MKHVLFDGDTRLGTVSTDPFELTRTDAGRSVSALSEYETPGELLMMEGETGPDGQLSLEEDWVQASDEVIQQRLAHVADILGYNIVPESDLTNDA